jgi:hypothetical protein
MRVWVRQAALVAGWTLALGAAQAQGGIYTCVDAKGHRITADRLIPECSDREQRLLSPTGSVRGIVPPNLTAREREAKAEQDGKLDQEKQRKAEERRAERALVTRYPNRAAHDAERVKALRLVQASDEETKRINARFDEELARLQPLWTVAGGGVAAAPTTGR